MFQRIEIKDDDFQEVIDKARVNVLIRLANIQHNWSSLLDKDLARKVPELKKIDEEMNDPQLGSCTKVTKTIKNIYVLGHHVIDFYNLYCLEKDASGKFSLNENYFISALKELEKSHRGKLFAILVKNEGSVSKPLVYKILQETIKFNKVQILG